MAMEGKAGQFIAQSPMPCPNSAGTYVGAGAEVQIVSPNQGISKERQLLRCLAFGSADIAYLKGGGLPTQISRAAR